MLGGGDIGQGEAGYRVDKLGYYLLYFPHWNNWSRGLPSFGYSCP